MVQFTIQPNKNKVISKLFVLTKSDFKPILSLDEKRKPFKFGNGLNQQTISSAKSSRDEC